MDHPDPQAIFGFALGELSGDGRRAIADHVRACESCAQTVMELTSRPVGGSSRPPASRFSPAERIRNDDDRRQFSRPVRALLFVALVGVLGFMFVGAFLISSSPPHKGEFKEKEYALAIAEAKYLESQGRLSQAISSYRQANGLYRRYWGSDDDEMLLKIRMLERKAFRREKGKREFDTFVSFLTEAEAPDLDALLREGRFLREEYRDDDVPWMEELDRILDRLEKVARSEEATPPAPASSKSR